MPAVLISGDIKSLTWKPRYHVNLPKFGYGKYLIVPYLVSFEGISGSFGHAIPSRQSTDHGSTNTKKAWLGISSMFTSDFALRITICIVLSSNLEAYAILIAVSYNNKKNTD